MSVSFGKLLQRIGSFAFSQTGLTSVTLPNEINEVGDFAFSECTNLMSVTGLTADSLGQFVFKDCSNLTSVTIGSTHNSNIRPNIFEGTSSKLRCDKLCGGGSISCNPTCGVEGCSLTAMQELTCPGSGDCQECPKRAGSSDAEAATSSASGLFPWSSAFTMLAVVLFF